MYLIEIGKDKNISCSGQEYGENYSAFDLDSLIYSSLSFWRALEIHCVGGCCGLDAFSFWKEDVVKAADQIGKPETLNMLINLKSDVCARQETFCDSYFFNTSFPKEGFVQLLDHLTACIES